MIKLLKNLKRREIIMAVICALLILGQIYFDLTLPDYITDITKLINSPDAQTADIMSIGLYLCRKILDKLGHGITIESKIGAGTKVKVYLGDE